MKLLEKKQINENIQIQRKNQIDSGIFLAKKIDALREELSSLEKQRTDFISGSRKVIEDELSNLQSIKKHIENEIKESEKKLAKLREPLDKEWANLEQQKNNIINIKIQTEQYFQEIIKEKNNIKILQNELDELHKTAEDHEYKTYIYLESARQDKKQAKNLLTEIQSRIERQEKEIYQKEIEIDRKEKDIKQREEKLKKEKIVFNKEKKLLEIKKQRIS